MSTFGPKGGTRLEAIGQTAASTVGTTVTTNASAADIKGGYAELTSSMPFKADGVVVVLNNGEQYRAYFVDIAIGAASSEQNVIENLFVDQGKASDRASHIFVPVAIPEGVRVSARAQTDSGTSVTIEVSLMAIGGNMGFPMSFGRCGFLGADLSLTRLTQLGDPGATAHTKGAWTELSSSLAFDARALSVFAHTPDSSLLDGTHFVDIGVGSAASEQVIVPDLVFGCDAAPDFVLPQSSPIFPLEIPSGSRVAARHQTTVTAANDRLLYAGVMVFG